MTSLRRLSDGSWNKDPSLLAARRLIFAGLSKRHKLVALGQAAHFLNGTSYDKGHVHLAGAVPIIRISNISDPSSQFLRTDEVLPSRFLVAPGDLLVSWSASFKSVIWPGPAGYLNQHIFKVSEQPGFNRSFLRHAIEASFDKIQEGVVGIGMMHLRREAFLSHEIPSPPINLQEVVARYLDAIEGGDSYEDVALRSELKREIDSIEMVRQIASRIEEARRLRGEAEEDSANLLVALAHRRDLADAEKSSSGWVKRSLGDCLELVEDPVTVDVATSYANIGIYSFARGLFAKEPISGLETSASRLFRIRGGQFIYSRLFAFEGAYGVVPPEFDGAFVSNEYPTFNCKPNLVKAEFVSAYFRTPTVWRAVAAGSKGLGDRRQRVHPQQVLRHELWVPPIVYQETLVQVERKLAESRASGQASQVELDAVVPAVLDRAFRGGM